MCLSPEQREKVKQWVQRKATAIAEKDPEFNEFVEADKRRALFKEIRRIEREIQDYVLEAALDDDESPLLWWQNHEGRFSHLSLLARRLFSIAGSTAELERTFSRSSSVANAKRPRIHCREIMFCRENV